jgi:hypothetical protein
VSASAYRDQPVSFRVAHLEREIDALERRLPDHVWPRLPSRRWSELMRATRVSREVARAYETDPARGEAYEQALVARRDALAAALEGAEALRAGLREVPDGLPSVQLPRVGLVQRWRQRVWRLLGSREHHEGERARSALLEAIMRVGRDVVPLVTEVPTTSMATYVCDDVPLLASARVYAARRDPFVVTKLAVLVPHGAVAVRVRGSRERKPTIEIPGAGAAESAARRLVEEALEGLRRSDTGFKLAVGFGTAELTFHGVAEARSVATASHLLASLRQAPVASWVDAIR